MKSVLHTLLRGTRGRMAVRNPGAVPGQGAQCCSWKLKKSRGWGCSSQCREGMEMGIVTKRAWQVGR